MTHWSAYNTIPQRSTVHMAAVRCCAAALQCIGDAVQCTLPLQCTGWATAYQGLLSTWHNPLHSNEQVVLLIQEGITLTQQREGGARRVGRVGARAGWQGIREASEGHVEVQQAPDAPRHVAWG
jgi:hypothetical protein